MLLPWLFACTDAVRPSQDPSWNVPDSRCPAAPSAGTANAAVTLAVDGRRLFRAELAATAAEQDRGLMYRRSLPLDAAMIFPAEKLQDNRFWMKDTCLPLDLVWLDADGRVLAVQTAPAMEEVPRGIGAPSLTVVELGAGVAAANGIAPGARLTWAP